MEELQSKGGAGCGFTAPSCPSSLGAMGASQAAGRAAAGLGKAGGGAPTFCRNQKQEQWGLEKEPKVSMKSHEDGWCWFLDVREGTSPDPRAAGAREDQPSDLPPAEGLQTHSCRNKQFLKLRISWTQSVEMGWDGPHTPDQA